MKNDPGLKKGQNGKRGETEREGPKGANKE